MRNSLRPKPILVTGRAAAGMAAIAGVRLLGAAQASAQDKEGWPQRLTLATGPTGGFAVRRRTG